MLLKGIEPVVNDDVKALAEKAAASNLAAQPKDPMEEEEKRIFDEVQKQPKDFYVCPVDLGFMDFLAMHKLFPHPSYKDREEGDTCV